MIRMRVQLAPESARRLFTIAEHAGSAVHTKLLSAEEAEQLLGEQLAECIAEGISTVREQVCPQN